jgi:hypothetical protein
MKTGQIKLPSRTESIVRVPVAPGSPQVGIITKRELQEGVILAASLTKVVDAYAVTSVLNTNEVEMEVQEPVVELAEIEPVWERCESTEFDSQDRERDILTQLRLDHLNAEERKLLIGVCSDFSNIFCVPGDKLSSMGAGQHSISVEPGTEPINTRPYRLPEAQKVEVNKQVQKLLQEGI